MLVMSSVNVFSISKRDADRRIVPPLVRFPVGEFLGEGFKLDRPGNGWGNPEIP